MQFQGNFFQEAFTNQFRGATIEELFAESMRSGYITDTNCFRLRAALLEGSLSEEERAIVTRILYSLRRGTLKITD
ncbi:hypothetical protein [Kamptonema formosum]|uniref:hypothetical protein n=1 Tax=Kamptonema formosum TaxID=331992 RepID=UPI00034BFDE2|nr:hypothetical protein [Oscillatoria sp. PCC 10802]